LIFSIPTRRVGFHRGISHCSAAVGSEELNPERTVQIGKGLEFAGLRMTFATFRVIKARKKFSRGAMVKMGTFQAALIDRDDESGDFAQELLSLRSQEIHFAGKFPAEGNLSFFAKKSDTYDADEEEMDWDEEDEEEDEDYADEEDDDEDEDYGDEDDEDEDEDYDEDEDDWDEPDVDEDDDEED
jgi:hypothetical protein